MSVNIIDDELRPIYEKYTDVYATHKQLSQHGFDLDFKEVVDKYDVNVIKFGRNPQARVMIRLSDALHVYTVDYLKKREHALDLELGKHQQKNNFKKTNNEKRESAESDYLPVAYCAKEANMKKSQYLKFLRENPNELPFDEHERGKAKSAYLIPVSTHKRLMELRYDCSETLPLYKNAEIKKDQTKLSYSYFPPKDVGFFIYV